MAKMFYTTEQVLEKLGITPVQLKQLVADGRLREFADGNKTIFKVADVDPLASPVIETSDDDDEISIAPSDSADDITLSPTDTGSQIGLAPIDSGADMGMDDSSGDIDLTLADSGSQIGLTPSDSFDDISLSPTDTGSQIGITSTDSADQISLEDTSQMLSDDKEDTVITNGSVAAMADSGGEFTDPAAVTQADLNDEGIQLDSDSSGSGLLDLSREADDTSLGIELLEEIYPGTNEAAVETQLPTQLGARSASVTSTSAQMEAPFTAAAEPARAAIIDPTSGAFGAMMVLPFIVLIYLAFVTASAIAGVQPAVFNSIIPYIWYVIGGAGGITVIVLLGGMFIANQAARGPRTKAKKSKAKKTAKQKKPKKAK